MSFQFCPQCGAPLQDALSYGKTRRICTACTFIHFHDPKVAACTFIQQAGKALLVKRAVDPEAGKWALPAGFVDFGEPPAQAAIRETLEETGLAVEIIALWDVMFDAANSVILIVYAANPIGGTLQAADDAEEVGWFTPHDLPELAFESTRAVLARWVSTL